MLVINCKGLLEVCKGVEIKEKGQYLTTLFKSINQLLTPATAALGS